MKFSIRRHRKTVGTIEIIEPHTAGTQQPVRFRKLWLQVTVNVDREQDDTVMSILAKATRMVADSHGDFFEGL